MAFCGELIIFLLGKVLKIYLPDFPMVKKRREIPFDHPKLAADRDIFMDKRHVGQGCNTEEYLGEN